MPNSSSSTIVLLPFGACTGIVPVDTVFQRRVLGDFSNVMAWPGKRPAEPVAASADAGGRKDPWK